MAKINYTPAIGRRKRAVARVRLLKGKEPIVVNNVPAATYFPGLINQKLLQEPLRLCELEGKYTVTVRVVGSGPTSQLLAVIHAIARAIVKLNSEKYKPRLKAAGFLRRDPRKRQRRMVGTGGKSRRQKQSPKR
ncbi:MAG: 30S ribosomal protein S9 [Patescibacteria group bacterium]|nr:30S ribosomal protein S9 [Patescibacteria group bacterium]MDP4030786.1 30S ribosomal protein S9 [Candidatus Beckwithbacteria bacterium]MDZ4228701.1 30S ribosomal protein S9 [Patescibacteria group bacterium]